MCYDFIAHVLFWQLFSFYEYAHGRSALNGRVTCFPDSLVSYPLSRVTCHRLVYSYVPIPVSYVSPYLYRCTDMDWRLVSLRFSLTSFSFCLVNSSMLTDTAYAFPFAVCRLVCCLVIFGLWLVTESFSCFVSLYLYLTYCLYIWVGDGTTPHLQSTLQPP